MMFPAINKEQVRNHFSEHAGEYDLYARVQKRVASRLLELTQAHPFSGPVLDVGTGTGEIARRLLEKTSVPTVVVSDLAHDMTRTAHQNLPGVLAADGDAQALPFRDNSFGLVLSASVFQWIEDLPTAFAECRRVLKPGGIFSFAMFCDGTLVELRESFRRALDSCGSDWPFHFQAFPVRSEVAAAMVDAGFPGESCHVEIEKEFHADFRSLMVGLKKIGAQNASRNRPKGLFPRRVMQEMSRIYHEEFREEDGLSASYGVLYGFALNRK
jgi:malonyl-CoA O-methyltransferase